MRDEVFILGGYQTDFARNWAKEHKHIAAMLNEALVGGLEVSRLDPAVLEAAFVGNFAAELFCRQGLLGALLVEVHPALLGLPTMRVEAACASGAVAILTAMAHIQAGIYDVVCVLGIEQMKTVEAAEAGDHLGTAAWYERESKGVEFPFPKLFGQLGDEYERRYGLRSEHLARLSALNYANAKRNPKAQTRQWFMEFEHANTLGAYNVLVGNRLRVTDCSQITDGAVCLFLASPDFAARFAKQRGLDPEHLPQILGWGHKTAPLLFSEKLRQSAQDPFILPLTRRAILDAYGRAGITGCRELDLIETHDCFTTSEYMAIDHFGITPPGESWKAIEDGTIEFGGRLPINPSGGLIGCGHPVGGTGVRQVLDASLQVTGRAGTYQVEGARTAATLNLGGSATTSVCFIVGW